jgi:hypothetical protein
MNKTHFENSYPNPKIKNYKIQQQMERIRNSQHAETTNTRTLYFILRLKEQMNYCICEKKSYPRTIPFTKGHHKKKENALKKKKSKEKQEETVLQLTAL